MKYVLFVLLATISLGCFAAEPVFINSYEDAIENKNKTVLVIFGSDWCGNCIKLKEELNHFDLDDCIICIVDVEKRKDLSKEYGVKAYPTSVIIKNKKEISRKIGYKKLDFERWMNKNK